MGGQAERRSGGAVAKMCEQLEPWASNSLAMGWRSDTISHKRSEKRQKRRELGRALAHRVKG